jgi:hypothetical protein
MRATMFVLLLAAPLAALPAQGIPVAKDADPTRRVAGSMPAGWVVRLDAKDTTRYTAADTRMVREGNAWRVTSGPAALYYSAAMTPATPEYTLRATFTSPTAPRHAEAYGLFLGGRDLENPAKQDYAYFLVRGDGKWLLNHRAGGDVHRIHPWTADPAVHTRDANGRVSDRLEVKVAADSVRFLVNGAQMTAIARSHFGASGIVGLRVNHNLDVLVEGLEVVPDAR